MMQGEIKRGGAFLCPQCLYSYILAGREPKPKRRRDEELCYPTAYTCALMHFNAH